MELSREKRNLILFIISYCLNNLISGVLYDTYVNYLQEASVHIATSFWAFYGYATFIAAFLLFFVPKAGYKKLLLFCSIAPSAAFFLIVSVKVEWILYISTIFALTSVQLHYVILAPFVAQYSDGFGKKNINWYTRAYYMGYVGYFLATYLGGVVVVKMFSVRAGLSYQAAKKLTKNVASFDKTTALAYLQGNEDTLIIVGIIAIMAVIPVLLMKEKAEDYRKIEKPDEKISWSQKMIGAAKVLLNKEAAIYLVYWTLISFAMGLFTSYYTVFLNRNLHIDKATSSLLVSVSYLAIVIFMLLTPFVVGKLGNMGTIVFTVVASVPFMLVIAEGDKFGKFMVPAVGMALFVRAGLANLGSPADSAITMEIVPKEMRPAYTSLVNFLAGLISIVSGTFTGKILFVTQEGYRTAYFIAGALYLAAALILYIGLGKTHGRKKVRFANTKNN